MDIQHYVRKQAFEYFGVKHFGDDAIAKAPSVILTDVEHQAITAELNPFWAEVRNHKPPLPIDEVTKRLRAKYQKVYRDHPHWLQSIQHLFKQIP